MAIILLTFSRKCAIMTIGRQDREHGTTSRKPPLTGPGVRDGTPSSLLSYLLPIQKKPLIFQGFFLI